MPESKRESIHKAVEKKFEYYESMGYKGHKTQPQIIEDSEKLAEKLSETNLYGGPEYVASVATYLACESRGCPINLRMAKKSTKRKLRIGDLQKFREITGIEPKRTAEDWIDGVIRALKNENLISSEKEEKVMENAFLEIPKVSNKPPRYRAIKAVYEAMKSCNINIDRLDMMRVFNISEPNLTRMHSKPYYDKIAKDVAEFLRNTPETFYKSSDLVEIFNLDVRPRVLSRSLSRSLIDLGIRRLKTKQNNDPSLKNYFGFSNVCGPGYCYSEDCNREVPWSKCRLGVGKKNTELKFYSKN